MTRPGSWLRLVGGGLVAGTLAAGAGCLSFLHPVAPLSPEQTAPCAALPQQCRNHVYVFFVHGLDPLDYANLAGVRDHVQSVGFLKTYYGQLYHTRHFAKEIRRIHTEDPSARFVLVGFSLGANKARDLAHAVREAGVSIDLLVYLGGDTLENTPANRPENVSHLVNIQGAGYVWNGATLDGAENVEYTDAWHFGSPTHPETLALLDRELAAVAARVPVVVRASLPPLEDAPTPRPVTPAMPAARDEWDFLKPVPEIEEAPAPRSPARPASSEPPLAKPQ